MKKLSLSPYIRIFILALSIILLLSLSTAPVKGYVVFYLDNIEYELKFRIRWHAPANDVYVAFQNITSPVRSQIMIFLTRPREVVKDVHNNTFARYRADGRSLTLSVKVIARGTCLIFNRLDVGGFNEIPLALKDLYTKPERLIESDHLLIASKAIELKGDDLYTTVKNVFAFTNTHVKYREMTEAKGALWALTKGEGDCTEYASLMVALLRALGIPSRVSVGYSLDPAINDLRLHSSVEVYMPRIGWVSFNPTWNLFGCWRHATLLRCGNEIQGPFVATADGHATEFEVDAEKIVYSSFSDLVQLEPERLTLKRTFDRPDIPSSILRLPIGQNLSISVGYSAISLQSQALVGFSALNYFTSTILPISFNATIEGPIRSFVLFQFVQSPAPMRHEAHVGEIDGKPILNVAAKGKGYVLASVYYVDVYPLFCLGVFASAIIAFAVYRKIKVPA